MMGVFVVMHFPVLHAHPAALDLELTREHAAPSSKEVYEATIEE
jgi:hypothetical protein